MNKTSLNKIVLLIGLMAILISACGSQPTPVVPADKVTIQLSWFHGVEYAGFYTAVEKGYYKEENIEIVLNQGTIRYYQWRQPYHRQDKSTEFRISGDYF